MEIILLIIIVSGILIRMMLLYHKNSKWITEETCIRCNTVLSDHEIMYSNGRCPECGYKHPEAITIIKTKETAVKYVYEKPWYIFWEKPKKITKE